MRKFFGWLFLLGGICGAFANFAMMSQGKPDAGSTVVIDLGLAGLGIYLLNSGKPQTEP